MKKIGREEIERYYDSTKSIKDNIAIMSKNGFQVSKDTLYRYCKEKGIGTKTPKDTVDADAKELVDPTLTTKENQKKLYVAKQQTAERYVDYGINLSLEKISRLNDSCCDRNIDRLSEESEASEPEVTEPVAEEKQFGVLSPENQKIVDEYLEYEKSGGWNKDYPPFPW